MKLNELINVVKRGLQEPKDEIPDLLERQATVLENIANEAQQIISVLSAANKQLQLASAQKVPTFSKTRTSIQRAAKRFSTSLSTRRGPTTSPSTARRAPARMARTTAAQAAPLAAPISQEYDQQQPTAIEQPPATKVGDVLKAAALVAGVVAISQTDFGALVKGMMSRLLTDDIADEIEDKSNTIAEELQDVLKKANKKKEEVKGRGKEEPGAPSAPKTEEQRAQEAEDYKRSLPRTRDVTPGQEAVQPQPRPRATQPQPPPTAVTPTQPPPTAVTPKQSKQPAPSQPLPRPPVVEKPSIQQPSASAPSSITTETIKKFEGKYFEKATWDNIAYGIGYGHLILPEEIKQGFIDVGDGERVAVTGEGGKNTTITKEQAEKLLAKDVSKFEKQTAASMGEAWSKLNESQKAALVSYAYNIGSVQSLIAAGLKKEIMAGNMEAAAKIIEEKGVRTEKKKFSPGLANRRKSEAQLFRSGSNRPTKTTSENFLQTQPTSGNQPTKTTLESSTQTQPIKLASPVDSVPSLQKQPPSLQTPNYDGPALNDRSGIVAFNQQQTEEPTPIINVIDNSVITQQRKRSAPQIDSPSTIYSTLT